MPDLSELTHNRVRCYGQRIVHRRDQTTTPKTFYVTDCGSRVEKTAAVLTADPICCEHHGCKAAS